MRRACARGDDAARPPRRAERDGARGWSGTGAGPERRRSVLPLRAPRGRRRRGRACGRGDGRKGREAPGRRDAAEDRRAAREQPPSPRGVSGPRERPPRGERSGGRRARRADTCPGGAGGGGQSRRGRGACCSGAGGTSVPGKEYPDFNFVGRVLGPGGPPAKQLGAETGGQRRVPGPGAVRDAEEEEQSRGAPAREPLREGSRGPTAVGGARSRAETPLEGPFCLSFLLREYWNKSKEKKVPCFPSWSFIKCLVRSAPPSVQADACPSVAQHVKEDRRGAE